MEIDEIFDRKSLENWFADKPYDWAAALSFRAALRTFPAVNTTEDHWLGLETVRILRALSIVYVVNERTAPINADSALDYARVGMLTFLPGLFEGPARNAAKAAIDCRLRSSSTNVQMVGEACSNFPSPWADIMWRQVRDDCRLVQRGNTFDSASNMAKIPLWTNEVPQDWQSNWRNMAERLHAIDANFHIWTEWFENRLEGKPFAFEILGDVLRREEKLIFFRLIDADQIAFWGKSPEVISAEVSSWLVEARARFAPPSPPQVEIPPQNRNAISFRQDEDGRIAIDTSASVELLRTDADARDRHAEAVAEARAVLNRCRGNNAAARLTFRLENYLAAAGNAIGEVKPSLLVQRGERLRQELAAYAAPDTLLDPIADDILVDLKGWQSAHNMMVGLDPTLMAMDTAMLGPDRKPALIPPDEFKQFARDAQANDLLAEGTEEVLIEAADLALAAPDPANRRSIWSAEIFRNLVLEAFGIAINKPAKTAILGFSAAKLMLDPLKAAKFLVEHREWLTLRLGDAPTWQSLFVILCDRLEKETPFKPK